MCKETQARDAGYDVVTALNILDDKAHYYPDASSFITKVIADRASHKLLGVQMLGSGAVDKMADIAPGCPPRSHYSRGRVGGSDQSGACGGQDRRGGEAVAGVRQG